jgi:hypothetical protein
MNILSDYFQEAARIKSIAGYQNECTLDYWRKPSLSRRWMISLFSKDVDLVDSFQLREAIYQVSKRTEPSTFKV